MDERQLSGAAAVEPYLTALIRGSKKSPGIQYVVVTATDVLLQRASGWADLERQQPLDAATTMMAYSMSKTITTSAVLRLVERGHRGTRRPVERYVEAFPYGVRVTVRQSWR